MNSEVEELKWIRVRLDEVFDVNPQRTIKRGCISPFIPMEALPEHFRDIRHIGRREFTGSGSRFMNGDILLARITPSLENGKTAYLSSLPEGSIAFGSTEYIIIASKIGITNSLFGYYLVRSPKFRAYAIASMEGTSGRQRVPSNAVGSFTFCLPPLPEQKAIAHILGTLDDKIELNRKMNETLEAMSQAIFKSWFVDFDPVRAKASGESVESICKRLHLTPEILDLFPNRLVESELGEIPEGWEIKTVKDIGKVVCGKTPPTKDDNHYGGDIPFITIPDMHQNIFSITTRKSLSTLGANSQINKTLPPNSICISCIATPGLVVLTTKESQTNQQINSVIPHKTNRTYYWFWIFRSLANKIKIAGSGGSVFVNLNTSQFSKISILVAPDAMQKLFQFHVSFLFKNIILNLNQTETLASIRDALLPKLLSGDIRVTDMDSQISKVS